MNNCTGRHMWWDDEPDWQLSDRTLKFLRKHTKSPKMDLIVVGNYPPGHRDIYGQFAKPKDLPIKKKT